MRAAKQKKSLECELAAALRQANRLAGENEQLKKDLAIERGAEAALVAMTAVMSAIRKVLTKDRPRYAADEDLVFIARNERDCADNLAYTVKRLLDERKTMTAAKNKAVEALKVCSDDVEEAGYPVRADNIRRLIAELEEVKQES